jgi:UDP-N-acetylmuramoyl-tripeptide--D-alanyl-D-alanine ligase
MQAENNFIYSDDLKIKGLEFILKLKSKKTSLSEDVKLYDVLGDGHVYSLAAAVCVGLYFDLKFTEIIKSFKNIEFPNSRMRILKGINDSVLIDDSYNASPKAVTMAINTLNKIVNKGKKIIVLGHMAELSEDVREEEHLKMAELAVRFADIVCFVGYNNELFKLGVKNDDGKAKFFKKSEEVLEYLKDKVEGDDIVLVKGSQSARCEKVIVGLLKNYGDRYEVCRQEKEWSQR